MTSARRRSSSKRALLVAMLAGAAAIVTAIPARAATPDTTQAKEAYDRGLEAHERGDHRTAAAEFAQADALAPSPIALQAALDAAIEADDAALGAELLARSKRAPPPPALAASITAAHLKFRGRADAPADVSGASASPTAHGDGHLPRIFVYGGAGLTVLLAGATTYFALDTKSEHDKFEDTGCGQTNFPECASIKSGGESRQVTTNVLLVATVASAVATTVVGAAFTNWRGPLVALVPGGGSAVWRATF